jgi:hypothetical protein
MLPQASSATWSLRNSRAALLLLCFQCFNLLLHFQHHLCQLIAFTLEALSLIACSNKQLRQQQQRGSSAEAAGSDRNRSL